MQILVLTLDHALALRAKKWRSLQQDEKWQSVRVCEEEDCTQKSPGEQLDGLPYGWT